MQEKTRECTLQPDFTDKEKRRNKIKKRGKECFEA